MLSDTRVYKKLIRGNPLVYRVKTFNEEIDRIQQALPTDQDGNPSKLLKRFEIKEKSSQRLPYAYFLPKIHKPHPPLKQRPIIAQCSAFTTPLARFAANILSPLVGTFSSAHLNNSDDFTSHLTSFYTNNPHLLSAPLLSLDAENLFTNVPLPTVLSFLRRKFTENDLPLPSGLTLDALIEIIELCCESTVFTFNDCFYQQIEGVAMGSPLACILANLFMEYFESELVTNLPYRPALWLRFVDDVICIWPHEMELFQPFLDGLNQLIPSIKMTVEWESMDNENDIATLPFLDSLIHRSSSGVTFSVYRKPTHCHSYIHYFSNHAPHVKKGVLSGLFLRALRISSPEHLQSEYDILTAAFRQLGYPHFFIREALSAAKTKFYATPNTTPNPPTYRSKFRPVVVPFSDYGFMTPILHASNYRLSHNYRDTIGRAVINKKGTTKDSTHFQSGVYVVSDCETPVCDEPYFGMTRTTLQNRTKKHEQVMKSAHQVSALREHARKPGHRHDPQSAKLVWTTSNRYECQVVEASCIKSFKNCNISEGEVKVSSAQAAFFIKSTGIKKPKSSANRTQQQLPSRQPPLYVSRLSSTRTTTAIAPDRTQPSIAIPLPPSTTTPWLPHATPTRPTLATNYTSSSQPAPSSTDPITFSPSIHPVSQRVISIRQQGSIHSPRRLRSVRSDHPFRSLE